MRSISPLVEIGRSGDGDFLLPSGSLVVRSDVDDAIGVYVEGHFDLGHATRRRRNALQPEATQGHIVSCHRSLALQHVDVNRGLVVFGGGEDFGSS